MYFWIQGAKRGLSGDRKGCKKILVMLQKVVMNSQTTKSRLRIFEMNFVYRGILRFGSRWSYVLAKIQNRFWVLHGQSAVRSYLKNCVFCQLRNAESSTQFMAALPKERLVSGERTFFSTGCDMFGPFFVTDLRKD